MTDTLGKPLAFQELGLTPVFYRNGGHKPVSVCQWPECAMLASREIKVGLYEPFVALCPSHYRQFKGQRQHTWQPRQKRKIT